MEKINRTPFQGIANIIRFNWHLYVLFLLVLVVGLLFTQYPLTRYDVVWSCHCHLIIVNHLLVYLRPFRVIYLTSGLDDMGLGHMGI